MDDTILSAALFIITEGMTPSEVLTMVDTLESVGLTDDAHAFRLALSVLLTELPTGTFYVIRLDTGTPVVRTDCRDVAESFIGEDTDAYGMVML